MLVDNVLGTLKLFSLSTNCSRKLNVYSVEVENSFISFKENMPKEESSNFVNIEVVRYTVSV
jgi:hypothetical protein